MQFVVQQEKILSTRLLSETPWAFLTRVRLMKGLLQLFRAVGFELFGKVLHRIS
jgi:hypothetical protein